jgi:peptide/nickel transport system substrate-binding protein
MMRHLRKPAPTAVVVVLVIFGGALLQAGPSSATAVRASHSPKGSLQATITAGEWPNLDPALDTQDAADGAIMSAVFGGLFEFTYQGSPLRVVPDEAAGYNFTNGGKTFQITLRPGLRFSNGDPFSYSLLSRRSLTSPGSPASV